MKSNKIKSNWCVSIWDFHKYANCLLTILSRKFGRRPLSQKYSNFTIVNRFKLSYFHKQTHDHIYPGAFHKLSFYAASLKHNTFSFVLMMNIYLMLVFWKWTLRMVQSIITIGCSASWGLIFQQSLESTEPPHFSVAISSLWTILTFRKKTKLAAQIP